MAKRDIKAKRWARRSAKREVPTRKVDQLFFPCQVQITGDGVPQYRWGFYVNKFSRRQYRKSLQRSEWKNAE